MRKAIRCILAIVLAMSLLLTSNISVFAAAKEIYLSDLRIIYADDYDEAEEILESTGLRRYKILNENLNEGTGETGVWLAYATSTDIEDAITDLSIMRMDGGYEEGNYQAMLEASLEEYKNLCAEYEKAIDYFVAAYDAGYFLAEMAYRQLNFYTIETIGLSDDDIPDFEGELLGDIFYEGIDSTELAQMFMEGNTYVLNNVRALLAMGVSYNEDGTTYLEKVSQIVEEMDGDPASYVDDEDYCDEMAALISPTIITLKDMFKELEVYEDELNFNDAEVADEELKYAESKTLANMTREVTYLDGQTLYDFCLNYTEDKSDYTKLYPLVEALNDGQEVMTKLACYYNVIRYSMSDYPEEYLLSEVERLEEQYGETPFNLYEGVDRTVFKDTFALTSAASRADAYTEKTTLKDAYFGNVENTYDTVADIYAGCAGIGYMIWGAFERKAENAAGSAGQGQLSFYELEELKGQAIVKARELYNTKVAEAVNNVANQTLAIDPSTTAQQVVDALLKQYCPNIKTAGMSFNTKVYALKYSYKDIVGKMSYDDYMQYASVNKIVSNAKDTVKMDTAPLDNAEQLTQAAQATQAGTAQLAASTVLFIIGGAFLLYSVFSLGYTAYSYYHPDYADIPTSMVDMRETVYGDRYIKYEVVREAEAQKDGTCAAGDLNAFTGKLWNALYYTKSYEAGKPLLANEFVVSTSNYQAKSGYTPVHYFGEVNCYNLNSHHYNNKIGSIYMSVKQSKNDKAAVANVPQVVGSILTNGLWLLAGGVGALVGVGGTLGTQMLLKKKKQNSDNQNL